MADQRKIWEIAKEIQGDWDKVNFAAKPYLDAMFQLNSLDDSYGADDGRAMVVYFLSNATHWRGEIARRIKKELNGMLK